MSPMLPLHLAAGAAMTGVIWYVQLVHYPLYRRIGAGEFPGYHLRNTRATAQVVLPLMLLEASTGAWLWWHAAPGHERAFWMIILSLVAVAWASTFIFQIPCHLALEEAKDERLIRRLLLTNCIRVIAWTLKTGLLILLQPG